MELPDTTQGIDELVAAFEDLSLPRERWDHAAHLVVGLAYVLRHGPEAALDLLRDNIPAYNWATGRSDGERNGYRDDVTRFFVEAIYAEVLGREDEDPVALLAEICSGPLARARRPAPAPAPASGSVA